MKSMNALVLLLLSTGYMITSKYKKLRKVIFFVCFLYFVLLCSSLYFNSARESDIRYEAAVAIFTLVIAAGISFHTTTFHLPSLLSLSQ